jgi:hypothetical protein
MECHSAADGLRPYSLVASGRKAHSRGVGSALALAPIEIRTHPGADLPSLLGPAERLPGDNQIAERLDPPVRCCLLTPEIEEVHAALGIEPDDDVHRIVAAICRDSIIRSAVDAQRPAVGDGVGVPQPFSLEEVPFLRGRSLLIER